MNSPEVRHGNARLIKGALRGNRYEAKRGNHHAASLEMHRRWVDSNIRSDPRLPQRRIVDTVQNEPSTVLFGGPQWRVSVIRILAGPVKYSHVRYQHLGTSFLFVLCTTEKINIENVK